MKNNNSKNQNVKDTKNKSTKNNSQNKNSKNENSKESGKGKNAKNDSEGRRRQQPLNNTDDAMTNGRQYSGGRTSDGKKSHFNKTQNKRNDKSETLSQRATFKDLGNQIMALKDEDEPVAIRRSKLKEGTNCR